MKETVSKESISSISRLDVLEQQIEKVKKENEVLRKQIMLRDLLGENEKLREAFEHTPEKVSKEYEMKCSPAMEEFKKHFKFERFMC